ncbi:LTA synthase family protein [Paenibacillus protaetiae]|uniref:LTA synthase family protein n=2 Tax=Paenibacillus protaetiae TaxID=2509456 RepID=A0A4P6F1M5_9BACL|nr:LTA synthase family protein [Paenibacillus protaetiae]
MVVFNGGPLWTTLLKEIPFTLILFCAIEWFATKRKLLYYLIVNLLVTAIFFGVFMYFKYYGVIATYHAFEQVNQVTAVKNSVFSLMDPYYLFIFIDIIIIGYFLIRRNKAVNWKQKSQRRVRRSVIATLFGISLALCLFNILPNRASMNEIVKAEQMGILNYEAYSLFKKDEEKLVDASEITQDKINSLKNIQPSAAPQYFGAAKGKNLIIIQMESFQNFLINLKIDGQEITPNLNKLVKDSQYFNHFFQMVGQGNTSDAEFVVNTSFYIPEEGAATMRYVGKQLPSLPKLMEASGYNTATFHTNTVEFWNRGELYKAVGWDKYYDQKFFGNDDEFFFGASDEVLFKKTAEELQNMTNTGTPYYTQIITMSAHHPFTIPESKYKMTLPDRYEHTLVGDYIRAQNYADYALGQFIADLKQRGIWDNSVVVLYGDHMGLPIFSLNNDEKDLMKEIYGHDYSYDDMMNIPLIISVPGMPAAEHTQLGGEIDILPTVANLLGVSLNDHIHFGQDLLNTTKNLIPQRYYMPTGSLLTSDEMFISGSGYDDGTHHPYGGAATSPAQVSQEQFNNALQLLNLSDSYVNQLPDREDAVKTSNKNVSGFD